MLNQPAASVATSKPTIDANSDEINLSNNTAGPLAVPTDQMYLRMEDGTFRQITVGVDGTLTIVSNEHWESSNEVINYEASPAFEPLNDTPSSVILNYLVDEVRKLRKEFGETTKKIDQLYETLATSPSVRPNIRLAQPLLHFDLINTVADATELEEKLENIDFSDQLVCILCMTTCCHLILIAFMHIPSNIASYSFPDVIFCR